MKVLFENDKLLVGMNSSDEVFVINKRGGERMRISLGWTATTITVQPDCLMEPWAHAGLNAVMISKKK